MIRNYGDVLSQMDSFLSKVAAEKKEAGYGGPDDDAKNEPQGATSTTVADAAAAQGQAGSEKASDEAAAIGGVEADTKAATVKAGDSTTAADTQGPNALSADQKVDEGDNMIKSTEIQKEARAAHLGNRVLGRIAALQKQAVEAAPAQDPLQKVAAENPELAQQMTNAYHEFALGFLRGHEKKAEDIGELLQSGLLKTAQEAEEVLDDVAAEDPTAVAPEEAYVEAPAEDGAPVDEAAALDEIATVMAEQGITPDDVMAAAEEIEQLKAAGFTDEDIIQASAEVAQEAAPAEAVPEAAPEAAPELEKMASEKRVEILKDHIRSRRK